MKVLSAAVLGMMCCTLVACKGGNERADPGEGDPQFHEIESGIGVVRGVVTDAEGNPLPMISMTVVNTEVGAATHLDGSFLIHSVPAGRQTLRFSGRGAGPAEVEVTVPASDTAEVAIEMPSGR